jgi:hypothetical protein
VKTIIRYWLGWIVVALALGSGSAAAEPFQPPADFKARYAVERTGLTLGRADLSYRRLPGDRYHYRLYTRAVGLARWVFPDQVREESRGRIVEDGFRPEVYRYQRTGGEDAREAELRFDWQALEVVNDIADYPWRAEITHDTIDRVISPLQLMHDLTERRADDDRLVYRIADGGRLKTYLLTIEGQETVTTPQGRFRVLRIERRDTDSDRHTILWCAPALGYLAVQVEQWEDGSRSARLVLESLEGLGREPAMRTSG